MRGASTGTAPANWQEGAYTHAAAAQCPAACDSCRAQRRTDPEKSSDPRATEEPSSLATGYRIGMACCSRRWWTACGTSRRRMTVCGCTRRAVNTRRSRARSCRQARPPTRTRQAAGRTTAGDAWSRDTARSYLSSTRGHGENAPRLPRFQITGGLGCGVTTISAWPRATLAQTDRTTDSAELPDVSAAAPGSMPCRM
jgi:hypothetical protein